MIENLCDTLYINRYLFSVLKVNIWYNISEIMFPFCLVLAASLHSQVQKSTYKMTKLIVLINHNPRLITQQFTVWKNQEWY